MPDQPQSFPVGKGWSDRDWVDGVSSEVLGDEVGSEGLSWNEEVRGFNLFV